MNADEGDIVVEGTLHSLGTAILRIQGSGTSAFNSRRTQGSGTLTQRFLKWQRSRLASQSFHKLPCQQLHAKLHTVGANSAHRLRANSSLVLSTMVGAAFVFCTYLCRTAAALLRLVLSCFVQLLCINIVPSRSFLRSCPSCFPFVRVAASCLHQGLLIVDTAAFHLWFPASSSTRDTSEQRAYIRASLPLGMPLRAVVVRPHPGDPTRSSLRICSSPPCRTISSRT